MSLRKVQLVVAVVVVAVAVAAQVGAAAPGDLDPTFGVGGIALSARADVWMVYSMVLQPDGKIVVSGSAPASSGSADIVLMRFQPDGTLDPGFGSAGVVTTDLGAGETPYAMALQPDGKIVVFANRFGAEHRWQLLRYLADG